MNVVNPQQLKIEFGSANAVSALLLRPPSARACFVFAHGAGAGMTHASMEPLAHATVRAAVDEAARCCPDLALVAGGKSFGGRMTSQAQAIAPLPGVRGLAFLGFPLHPAGKPSSERATHLSAVHIPMLFLQGTRDPLAALELLEPLCRALGERASLELFDEADHSFHVPARSGRTDVDVREVLLDALSAWIATAISVPLPEQ